MRQKCLLTLYPSSRKQDIHTSQSSKQQPLFIICELVLVTGNLGMQTNKVRFNVGGKIFETTTTTLANAGRHSVFGAMFDGQWNLQPRETEEEYFVDRDPECFSVLLNLLRTGKLHVPPSIPEKLLYEEALYYGLLDNVRTAKWGRLVGNQLNLTSSVRGRSPHGWTAIRASPDGGCAVGNGSMVHIYNWMLEEHAPLNLDYREVNDIGWINLENIVVSGAGRIPGQENGAMGLFSASTGDLRHRYEVKSQTVGALCFNSDNKIFASCTNGIGVWDQVTGTRTDFFNSPPGWALGDADKIQWLNVSNCLLAFYNRRTNHRRINLVDFREKNMVWSWSNLVHTREKCFYDAIAVEQSNSICVAGDYEGLGFIDLRSTVGSIRWNPRTNKNYAHHDSYSKLSLHGRHVFYACCYGNISVFSGPDYSILTSRLGSSGGGSISDFSNGGDRLFALHSLENVFDVWETPSPPIIYRFWYNVGGKIFETTATTLANASRNSVFGAMFDDQWNLQPRKVNDEYFVDRNPECFSVLLDLLRTGKLHVPPNVPEKLLYNEALFYGLLDN
ncbi:hypothetical protein MKX03_007817, partial [Papaver bracteatum]